MLEIRECQKCTFTPLGAERSEPWLTRWQRSLRCHMRGFLEICPPVALTRNPQSRVLGKTPWTCMSGRTLLQGLPSQGKLLASGLRAACTAGPCAGGAAGAGGWRGRAPRRGWTGSLRKLQLRPEPARWRWQTKTVPSCSVSPAPSTDQASGPPVKEKVPKRPRTIFWVQNSVSKYMEIETHGNTRI